MDWSEGAHLQEYQLEMQVNRFHSIRFSSRTRRRRMRRPNPKSNFLAISNGKHKTNHWAKNYASNDPLTSNMYNPRVVLQRSCDKWQTTYLILGTSYQNKIRNASWSLFGGHLPPFSSVTLPLSGAAHGRPDHKQFDHGGLLLPRPSSNPTAGPQLSSFDPSMRVGSRPKEPTPKKRRCHPALGHRRAVGSSLVGLEHWSLHRTVVATPWPHGGLSKPHSAGRSDPGHQWHQWHRHLPTAPQLLGDLQRLLGVGHCCCAHAVGPGQSPLQAFEGPQHGREWLPGALDCTFGCPGLKDLPADPRAIAPPPDAHNWRLRDMLWCPWAKILAPVW